MFEYVSKHSLRKDYEDSFHKYERELKVPYYCCSTRTAGADAVPPQRKKYVSVKPNGTGRWRWRLEIEVGLVDAGCVTGFAASWCSDGGVCGAARSRRRADRLERQLERRSAVRISRTAIAPATDAVGRVARQISKRRQEGEPTAGNSAASLHLDPKANPLL